MALSAVGLKTHIWNNNFKSILLLWGFPLLIFLMVWAFLGTLHYLEAAQLSASPYEDAALEGLAITRSYALYIIAGVGVWFFIAFLSHQRMINRATGAHPVTRREEPELYNMLENLCVSRGIPMPKLCLIESSALNAYASGISNKTYTVTVTTGLKKRLDKEEMEAVLAHELTHIVNKDVRLLIISVIFVGIISFLAEMVFRVLIRSSGNSRKNGGLALLIGLAVLVIGYLFAMVIRFALSRKREYLADAGAVELTKNPKALAGALRKISGHSELEKETPPEVKQMFIENSPKKSFFSRGIFSIFATHPPIEKRIEILEGMV